MSTHTEIAALFTHINIYNLYDINLFLLNHLIYLNKMCLEKLFFSALTCSICVCVSEKDQTMYIDS